MTGITWSFVDVAAHLLDREEREAVQGDLAESGESAWQGLLDVCGLIARRQILPWRNWRPWLATFGLALPATLLLMGFSLSVSYSLVRASDPTLVLCQVLLLIAWAWTGGFAVGSLSRRTVWVTAALSCLPCLFCLARFREQSLSRLCLLLFLVPAMCGLHRALRSPRMKLGTALVLAVGVTALLIPTWTTKSSWMITAVLSWPAWYLVATARERAA